MEGTFADRLARGVGSRRTLGALLGGVAFVGATGAGTAGKRKKGKHKHKKKQCKTPASRCTCAPRELCLSNGGCGLVCDSVRHPCPGWCACSTNFVPNMCEAAPGSYDCAELPLCAKDSDCPRDAFCQARLCNGSQVAQCVPLCTA